MTTKPSDSNGKRGKTVQSATAAFQINLSESRELDRKQLEDEISRLGGQEQFLASTYPLLARTAPQELSEGSLTRGTRADLIDAERRLHGCAMCPPEGGKCAADREGHEPGLQPSLETGRLVFSVCDRWPEYKIRTRLMAGGVPPRQTGIQVVDLLEVLSEAANEAVIGFNRKLKKGEYASLIATGSMSTELCASTLRAVVIQKSSMSFKFARCPELTRDLKAFFADQSNGDPLKPLYHFDLLVLTELDANGPPWLVEAIKELTYSRHLRNKNTIVGLLGQVEKPYQLLGYDDAAYHCDTDDVKGE